MATRSAPGATRLSEIIDTPRNGTVIRDILSTALAVPEPGQPLASLDTACRLLAESRDLAEIRGIRDMAEAARLYAKAIDRGLEAQNHAAEIKIRAERRAGELLADMPKNAGGNPNLSHVVTGCPPSYDELGIGRMQAHRWQQIAQMPEQSFEAHIQQTRESGKELTSAGALALASRFRPAPQPGSKVSDTRPLLRFCPPDMTAAQIVAAILRTSFPDALTALDVTYGFGAFWDGSAHVHVTGVDFDPSRGVDGVTDFRDLPFDDNSFDVVTFDPPHIADGGADGIMAVRYGTYVADDLEDAVRRGSTEAWRVARLGVVVKVTDAVHTSRYVAMSDWVRETISGPIYDVVYETRTHALVDPKWRDQLSARNNGATYLIFRTDGPVHVRRTVEATHAAD